MKQIAVNCESCVLAMLTHFWTWVKEGTRNLPWGVKESYIEQMYLFFFFFWQMFFWILVGRREGKQPRFIKLKNISFLVGC